MWAALFIIGVLFGLALAATVAVFYVLNLQGDFRANLKNLAIETHDRLRGRKRIPPPSPAVQKPAEPDPRVRMLTDELRMTHRLLEQTRVERVASVEAAARAAAESEELRQQVAARNEQVAGLKEELVAQQARIESLRGELAQRGEYLSRANREIRDLRNELDVLNSDVKVVNQ